MSNLNAESFRQRLRAGRVPLDCIVSPGMFSHERLILLSLGDRDYTMYVDEMLVDANDVAPGKNVQGKVWVEVRRRDPESYILELPEEGQLITVPAASVRIA